MTGAAGSLFTLVFRSFQRGSRISRGKARFYRLTREGRKQLQVEIHDWEQTAAIIGRFFDVRAEDLS